MLFITIITLIVAKALPVLNTQISSVQFSRITSIVFILSAIISLNCLNVETIGSGIGIYSGLFHITQISQIFEIFIFLIGGLILMGWYQPMSFLKSNDFSYAGSKSKDYSLIVLFSILGSSLLVSSFDLISIYLSIELQSFGLYVLSTLYRDSESSTSSGLKYFLLGGLSSCIILLGIGIIYSYTGLTNLESVYLLNTVSIFPTNIEGASLEGQITIQGLSLGLILIFVGFLFKIAAAPLHNWSPDVYDGTPTIVTTWLTIIPKIAILILLLELQTHLGIIGGIQTIILSNTGYAIGVSNINLTALAGGVSAGVIIKTLLLISSVLSLLIGSLLGLAQIKIKRLLAYSTISHIGFLLLALAINTEQSIDSFLFYILQYTITNLNIFLIILALSYVINTASSLLSSNSIKDINYISEFKGLFFSNPFLSLSLAISLFSMAGIPPLIGFFSKQFVLYSALQNDYFFISIIAIIVSVISASYYLKIVRLIFTNSSNGPNGSNETVDLAKLTNVHSFVISSLTLSILLFFIKPSIILNSTQLLSLSLFYI